LKAALLKAAFATLVSDREEMKSGTAKSLEYCKGQLSTQFHELLVHELFRQRMKYCGVRSLSQSSDEPKAVSIWI
jgi:hypothetical protein